MTSLNCLSKRIARDWVFEWIHTCFSKSSDEEGKIVSPMISWNYYLVVEGKKKLTKVQLAFHLFSLPLSVAGNRNMRQRVTVKSVSSQIHEAFTFKMVFFIFLSYSSLWPLLHDCQANKSSTWKNQDSLARFTSFIGIHFFHGDSLILWWFTSFIGNHLFYRIHLFYGDSFFYRESLLL